MTPNIPWNVQKGRFRIERPLEGAQCESKSVCHKQRRTSILILTFHWSSLLFIDETLITANLNPLSISTEKAARALDGKREKTWAVQHTTSGERQQSTNTLLLYSSKPFWYLHFTWVFLFLFLCTLVCVIKSVNIIMTHCSKLLLFTTNPDAHAKAVVTSVQMILPEPFHLWKTMFFHD